MGSAHSGTPDTSHASGPTRPFPRNPVGRSFGAIAPSPPLPQPAGAVPSPPAATATRFSFFHNVRPPGEMAEPETKAFLPHLAVKEMVGASTQNQALSSCCLRCLEGGEQNARDMPAGTAGLCSHIAPDTHCSAGLTPRLRGAR